MLLQPMPQRRHKAVTRIFFGGCHVELERRRREDRGAVGAEEGGVWGMGVPFPENLCIFYFKMVSFCACPHGFLFGIFFAEQIDKVG